MTFKRLKTTHDTDSGEPSRIKYNGIGVYASFVIETTAGSDEATKRTAVLDCVGTTDFSDHDDTAYIDLEELSEATDLVGGVPYIDDVYSDLPDVRDD